MVWHPVLGDTSARELCTVEPVATHAHAVITLTTGYGADYRVGQGWLQGTLTLGCSITAAFANAGRALPLDMVALFLHNETPADVQALKRAGWQCVRPGYIRNPTNHWRFDYTLKMIPFTLVQYERVVVVDSDMIVLQPAALDEMMAWPLPLGHIAAAHDCVAHYWYKPTTAALMIQGGLFVARPSLAMFAHMESRRLRTGTADGGGQGFISNIFHGNISWLPADRYNYECHSYCAALYQNASGVDDWPHSSVLAAKGVGVGEAEALVERHLAAGRIGLVHYILGPKPWECTNRTRCGLRSKAGFTGLLPLRRAWFAADDACPVRAPYTRLQSHEAAIG